MLWFLFLLFLFIVFYRPIRYELLPNLTNVKGLGVELTFVLDSIDAAIELAEKSPQWQVEITSRDKERALNRAKAHLLVFKGAQILWVDDHPENNRNEINMFQRLGAEIRTVENTEQAIQAIQKISFDLVLSDMARGDDQQAGLIFLKKLRTFEQKIPVIFYLGVFDPEKGVPPRSFGLTARPDELLHLTLDALERKYY